jgi:predicted dehydrogenase
MTSTPPLPPIKVGLVGAGVMGRRRAGVVRQFDGTDLAVVADADAERAKALAEEMDCEAADWRAVVARPDVRIVIVSTWPQSHAEVAAAAAENGKHVLCEKPFGRNPAEARAIVAAGRAHGVKVKTGFNLRYKAGLLKARELFDQGAIGDLMFIRCCHGHGGRPGYEQEWRADPEISGGGQLIELGVHGIDLLRWFMGELTEVSALTGTLFWEMEPLEDNAFILFRNRQGQTASFHSSSTQWKNHFSFEIFGTLGYILVHGMGGSYGVERVTLGRRNPGSVPDEEVFEFPGEDRSWHREWAELVAAVRESREPSGNGDDGYRALLAAEAVYASAREERLVKIPAGEE